jgi:hypothetical protein
MTRRRVLCRLLLLSAVLACFAGWLLVANARKITWARFEQVKVGMSRDEVIRIVGGPPGDYSDGLSRRICTRSPWFYQSWLYDEGELLVRFDDADRATGVVWRCGPPTFTEQVRRWFDRFGL